MKYTGYRELDSELKNLQIELTRIGDNAVRKIKQKLTAQLPRVMDKISIEILSAYKMIVYQEFQRIFYKNYGKNYDVNSLNNSLRFYIDNNLRPYVEYDESKLIITGIFKKNPRDFNQNAHVEGSFGRLMDMDEIVAIEEMEFEGTDIYLDNPYEWATEEMASPEDSKVFKRKTLIHEPKQVYKEAEIEADYVFQLYFAGVLAPRIRRQYGIKI